MGTDQVVCSVATCNLPVFDKYDRYCMQHVHISPNERVRDFDITEKTSLAALIKDVRAVTRYTWYFRPDDASVHAAELSLRIATEWKDISYNAIARLAVIMQYIYGTMVALKDNLDPSIPNSPNMSPLRETRASLTYLEEHCKIRAAKYSDLARDVPPLHYHRRRLYLQGADVWWKSHLKIKAMRETLGWLHFALDRFILTAEKARGWYMPDQDRMVLLMDAEILGGLAEALFKTSLLHYQELITV